ncbi:Aspercryptin biosynthesis cluster-specific transcription regulator atnN [Colletotrichum siamense]|nr:Aspercryptin biosynthesis cluster-specific transcription regulator atnN [Colletotrichum siamense]
MRSRRSHVTLGALSALPWLASGAQGCSSADNTGAITQEVVVVDHVPVHLSAAVCHNTVIDVAGTAVSVTNAPTVLVSDFIVQSTTTFTSTLHPSVVFEGPCTTLFRDGPPGSEPTTLVFPPLGDGVNGTKIICVPADPNWYEGLGPFKTGDSDPWGITRPAPTGTDLIDPATITPPTTTFTGPFATLTGAWTGTVPTTLILPPAGTVSVGTELILLPATTPPSFTGPYVTISGPYTGATPTTLALPPSGADTVGTQLVLTPSPVITSFTGPYVTATGAYTGTTPTTLLLPPSGTDTIGTQLVLTPAPSIFTGPFVTESGIWTGTFTNTLSLAPAGTDVTGTQLILYPTTTASQFTGPFTTLTAPDTGSVAATFTVPPNGADGTGTVIVLAPTSAAPGTFAESVPSSSSASPTSAPVLGGVFTSTYTGSTTSTSVLPSGPNGEPGATIIFVPSPPATATSVPASSILPGIYTTITSGYDGTVTSTSTISPTGTNTAGTVVILEPTTVPTTAAASFTTVTSAYTGSVTLTSTISPSVSGQPGTVVILDPSLISYSTLTSGYDGSVTTTTTVFPSGGGTVGAVVVLVPTVAASSTTSSSTDTSTSILASTAATSESSSASESSSTSAVVSTSTVSSTSEVSPTSGVSSTSEASSSSEVSSTSEAPSNSNLSSTSDLSSTLEASSTLDTTSASSTAPTSATSEVSSSSVPTSTIVTVSSTTSSPSSSSSASPSASTTLPGTPTTQTSQSSTFTGCLVTSSATASACSVSLTDSCAQLSSTNGLALAPVIAACTLELGPYAAGNVLTCLSTTISLTTTGQSIANCVTNALAASCPTTLPEACVNLQTSNGLALLTDIPLCTAALGPFAVGTAATCLATGAISALTQGSSVFECLQVAFGLAPSVVTVTNPALCPTQAPTATPSVCATVPAPCESLSTVDGLALIPAIPACTAALGAFAVGNAATCLATTAISVTTTGSSIVSCLENALSATCISTLPQACLDLAGDDAVALAVDLPLCALLPHRARKVKCDEAKPKCVRCTSSGRQCAGYEPTIEHGLAWYRPQQLTAHDQREGRAFQFFSHMVGPVLSGPTDSYFWTHLVVQFSHFEPAVRHAVLAISSLYEDFHEGERVTRQKKGNAFAISHYSAAIERIKGTQDEQLMLLVCVLFVCVEYLQGDVEAALRHCKHGILILNKVGCQSWAREYVMPIFRRLSFISFFLGAKPSEDALVPGLIGFEAPMPPRFESVEEAQSAIDDITVHAIELLAKGDESGKQPLQTRLQEFHGKVCELDATVPPQESSKKMALCGMKIKAEMARIQVNTIDGEGEMRYDEWADSFRRIVALGKQAAEMKVAFPSERPRASFTFEQGFLSMMGFVSIKCRDLQTRLEAIDLMTKIPAPKEALLDVGTLYRVGRRGAEIEHGVLLDDGVLERNPVAMAKLSFPPEDKRLIGAPIEHELDVIKNEDGTTTYRRTVHFLKKDADGVVHDQTEYLLDQKPGQTVVPDLPFF